MKNIQLITRQITLWALLTAGLFLNTSGQVYQPGDLYTFEDGSKGIVFYVNPDNPGSGTVAALHDLGEQYALWNGNKPSVMKNSTLHRYDFDYSGNISWSHEGKLFTQLLKASGASPLTDTIGAEIDNGWYIPDVVQLRCLLAMAPYLEEYFAAQQGEVFNMWNRNYWSSCFSPYEENKVYYVDKIRFNITDGSNSKYIRLVRDFPDSSIVHAFWKEFPPLSETKVSPDSTRDYDALVILRSDTIRLSGSVTVHHPVQDTIIYATSSSQLSDGEFIAACHTFTGITAPGSYTARDTLTAANGCDSIVVVTLIVTEDAHYYDTICPQVEQYVFAPFDTVFLSGTVSGEYIHHGSKVVDGHTVDTTAYLHLTVLPVYDIPDTVSWCLYGNSETMPYEHDPRVTLHAESTGGTVTISATSSNTAITIEEGTAVGDFLLHMTTVHGCDSIIRLHVRTTAVTRDTIYYDVSASHVTEGEITIACHTFTGITAPGSYTTRDTLTAANGCDSIVIVTLIVTEDAHYYDTICPQVEQYAFAPFDTVFLSGTASGEYIHHGSKLIDGHTVDTAAYLHLTVLPVYDIPDTVSWCLYGESETMPYEHDPRVTLHAESTGGTVAISATSSNTAITIEEGAAVGDFLLHMTTVHGCDSIVRLHVRTTAVTRDTMYSHVSVQQVQDNRVTVDNHTFENVTGFGSYTTRDTLTAANGCDSIVVVELIVTEDAHYYDTICPQVEQYVFAPFDTVFLSGTVSGEYIHHGSKVVDGHTVDTTAYLHLTVLPVYDIPDTVSWCLYGNSETMPYEHDPRITLSAETNDGTVTISATSSTSAIIIEEGTSTGDFLLRMTTVHGCDSIVRLHVRTTAVTRDTIYSHVSVQQVQDNRVTVDNYTFENVNGLGSYTTRDTLTAANGCDSIVVVELIVTEDAHYYDTICPQVEQYAFAPFDTVFLSGTVSGEYIHHGSKVVDGHTVDTTAYLHLTVLPVYDTPDTVSWCLYGDAETMSYPNDPRVTLTAETNGGTVTISATSSTSAITIEEGTSTGDFLLRMTTVHGCDSIVRLHVRTTAVTRDTIYYDVSASHVTEGEITTACHTFTGITAPGSYTASDTLTAANGCDSIVIVTLIVTEDAHYYDTICPQVDHYAFAPFDTVFLSGTVSGEYIHHGSKVVDGHTVDTTAYLHLTVLPVYDTPDTVNWCLYGNVETMPYPNDPRITLSAETNDGTVTISATSSNTAITIEEGTAVGDFLLHMTTVHGCDSIVRLHVRTTAVARDTLYSHVSVQQVQDNRVTVDNYTFENVTAPGSYTTRDTLTAANGCDSIVIVTLIVTEDAHYYDTICPQVEQYAFAPFDTVFLSGTASGEYIHHGSKVVDGHTVDTTAYLHLTVLPVYDIPDTVSWCLYGNSETMPYEHDPHVTLHAESTGGTVAISATSSTSAITIEEGTSTGDFLLRMTTVHGCDSIVRLHVRTTAVTRDTIYYDVSASHVTEGEITTACHTFTGITAPGSYTARDTLTAANGCDSIVVVELIVTEDAHYYDTICPQVEQYVFAPFDTVFLSGTASGEYIHHGSKVVDGHTVDTTAYLHLTVLPVYDNPDTVNWCLYGNVETMPYPNDPRVTLSAESTGGTVTISATSSTSAIIIEEGTSTGDFLLRMTTVHGCDSIVRLHVRTTAVTRDTMYSHVSVQQVQDNRVTVDNYTFENVNGLGSYTARDTLTAANGCDSIVVVTLIVTEDAHYYDTICPQVEQYVFAPFDTVFLSGTASGEYIHHGSKVIDGHTVDTTAFLHLTVLPVYDIPDTVSWCLYGESETMPYPNEPRVTLSAETNDGTVTISATSSNTAITIEEGTAVGDFLLRMTTVHGCDSIVRLHVRTTAVTRDTMYSHVSVQQVQDNRVTVDHYTFENVTAPGSYTTRDTLTAANGCDSIVVVTLIVTEDAHYYDTICPQMDQYAFAPFDTVFLSGTVSGEYIHHGSKVIDGHTVDTTAYLHLTVLPVYDIPDTVSWCLYGNSETMPYEHDPRVTLHAESTGGTVAISATSSTSAITIEEGTSTGDFLLRMTTVHGCDSIVRLHVRTTAVARDTLYSHVSVQQVQDNRVTVDNHTFENVTGLGSYTARDTLTAANGCDSIVVVELIVTEDAHYYDTICPQMDQYAFAPFDTVFLSGTVSGEYIHHGSKVVNGHTVDTTAYLHLTVLPVYDIPDTVNWCLYGNVETMPYPNDPRITLSAETNDGTVTISATSSNTAITIEEGTAVGDFLLRMTTVHGCDSIVRLHVRTTAVAHDTTYSHVSVQQVQDNRVTVDNYTFENVTAPGSYTARDTLTAANGCDSIVVVTLIVTEDAHYYDTICPQVDHYAFAPFDTVFLSGTVSGEYIHHGSKVIDGHTVDTTAYLQLTVLPVYDIPDTVSWCLYGESETMPYPNDPRITLSAETNDGTVTISATSSNTAITIEEGTAVGDFLLRMTTVHGCDSIVRLHVRTTAVTRDTIYYDVSASHVTEGEITTACHTFTGITTPGSYTVRDTLTAANGCDSIVVVTLIVTEDAHYYDTICPQVDHYTFAPFDTVFLSGTASGEYVHHGSKVIDGHTVDTTAYLHLTVLPVYDIPDTVSWCLYGNVETMPYPNDPRITLSAETNDGTVTISATSSISAITIEEGTSTGDFLLRMTTVHGCDSIVRLHVRTTAVAHDTTYSHVSVQQVQDNRVTVDNYTFENVNGLGSYTARDTLTAANGCDSIVVVTLIVTEDAHYYDTICPQVEQYVFAPLDTVFLSGTVSGEYIHHGSKVVDGHTVDTTAYLHLTVLPVYDIPDTVSWCLYGNVETMPYPNDPRITLSAETNDGTVTISATSSNTAITIEEGTAVGDFLLRMTTVHGCDSIVRLHVRTTAVTRDTMYSHVSVQQVQDNRVTVDNYTFENVNGLGSYTARDTLTAANGCDSIVVVELIVNGCSVDFTISCPPDIYDTLAFGDCAMTIYPEEIGTPTIQCDQEWPFFIRNDMPESSVFPQGDNIITWIATDSICGFSDTCEQHVFIAYPQCPDAIDCEGNIYAGIRIGCDCWTQRNLESTKYSDCTDIPDVMGYASLLHPDTANNIAIFGRLYTFEAAVRDSADNGHGHIQGICPEGWYLPTPEKYESLNEYGTEALRSPLYWIIGAGNNSTGFSALPAGYYNGEKSRYEGLLSETYFWSSQGVGTHTMRTPSFIAYYCDQVLLQDLNGGLGYSVRCIKERE